MAINTPGTHTPAQQAMIIITCFISLIVGNGTIISFSFSSFVVPVSTELGFSRSIASSALLAAMLAVSISSPIMGRLIDRFGVRRVVLPSIIVFSLATMAVGTLAAGPISFIVLYFMLGLVSSGQAPTPYSKVIAGWFTKRRGLALGVVMSAIGLGAAIAPNFVHALIENYGWRSAYVGLGLAVLLIAFPMVLIGVREPSQVAGQHRANVSGSSSAEIWKSIQFWRLGLVFSLIGLVATGCITQLIPMMTDQGVQAASAIKVASSAGLAVILGRVGVGFLLDRYKDRNVTIGVLALMMIGALLLAFAPLAGVVAGAVIMGIGLGAEVDMLGYMVARRFGMKSFGEAHGALFAMFTAASGLGALIMGIAYDQTGTYNVGLLSFVVALLIAVIAALGLDQPRADVGTLAEAAK